MFLIHRNNSELTGQIATQSVNSFPFCPYAHMKVCAHPLCNTCTAMVESTPLYSKVPQTDIEYESPG